MRVKTVGLMAVVALLIASCGGGSVASGGVSDGIGVHGAWTIDVINPDGSLDQHHEFDNALTDGGRALAALLSRSNKVARWSVFLTAEPDPLDVLDYPCLDPSGTPGGCTINEPGLGAQAGESDNLQVELTESVESSGIDDAVLLSGSIAANSSGDIFSVRTNIWICELAETCATVLGPIRFTEKLLIDPDTGANAPIAVAEGQTVQVEVVFTFGTAAPTP